MNKLMVRNKVDKVSAVRSWIAAGVAILVVVAGCGDPVEDRDVPEPVDRSRVIVESHLPYIDDIMLKAARQQAVRDALTARISEEAARPFQDRVEDGLRYSTVFQRTYVDGEAGLIFADDWGLSAKGDEVLAVFDEVDHQAMEVETLHRERIEEGRSDLLALAESRSVEQNFKPTVEEVEALIRLVDEAGGTDDDAFGMGAFIEVMSTVDANDDVPPGLERLGEFNRREAEAFSERAELMAELELWMADGAMRYSRVMRHGNLNRVDWREMRDAGGSAEVIYGRMEKTMGDIAAASAHDVRDVFESLEPSHPQYRGLFAAADRYREIVEDGGWPKVRAFTVEEGAGSAAVETLRRRLEAEGFSARPDDADSDEEFNARVVDASLIDGIRDYQRTHQFEADGSPTPGFWRSLNVSAEERLAQIELALQRWRESFYEDDEDFILVNIPSFHVEVWADGVEEINFSAVVGNNQRRCDAESGKWEYPNATPVMMSTMDHIMLNPSWYVPQRLVRETLMPKIEENPDYLEEEGFETITLSDGREAIRQLPGPDNALGQAKFIFENQHNVYLHDTPQKQYFDYNIRAYSHGCVRISKPVELAEFLLKWKGRDDVDVDEVLASDKTWKFEFERELPVLIEYYTVWIDEDGVPNFLSDIYRSDARRLSDDPEEFDKCTPTPAFHVPMADELNVDEEVPEDVDDDLGP